MRLTIAATMMLAVPATAQALAPPTPARALAGRIAGAPRMCVPVFASDIGGDLYASGDILYRGRGSTIYLNHPPGCPKLTPNRAIVSRRPTGSLCRGDIIEVVDQLTGTFYGSCALGDFVPYDRPRK